MQLWSVNHLSTSPHVNTCWRYELGPVVVDAPHVPHAGGSAWEPITQAKAIAGVLEHVEPERRGIDLNGLLIPAVYYSSQPNKRFAKREVVLNGFATGRLGLNADWASPAYDTLPTQIEQLLVLAEHLSNIGGVKFIWVGEPENFSADFLDPGLLVELVADPRWRARQPREAWDIDPRMITDWTLDFGASRRWKRAMDKALRAIVVNGARTLLRKSGILGMVLMREGEGSRDLGEGRGTENPPPGPLPLGGGEGARSLVAGPRSLVPSDSIPNAILATGPVIAWPYANVGSVGTLLGGNGELLEQVGGLDSLGTVTGYLYQAGARAQVVPAVQQATEMLARSAKMRSTAHKLNMQAGTAEERAMLIRLAEDLGHEHLVLWTNPGHPDAENAVARASGAVAMRRGELMTARLSAGVGGIENDAAQVGSA